MYTSKLDRDFQEWKWGTEDHFQRFHTLRGLPDTWGKILIGFGPVNELYTFEVVIFPGHATELLSVDQ